MNELILVVDDTPANLRLAEYLLTGAGFDARVARGAEEALALLTLMRPALILMDLQMPGIDGFALTRMLKQDPETTAIPILAVTAYAMRGDQERAKEAGCDGYLAKPLDPLTFISTVRDCIATRAGSHR